MGYLKYTHIKAKKSKYINKLYVVFFYQKHSFQHCNLVSFRIMLSSVLTIKHSLIDSIHNS